MKFKPEDFEFYGYTKLISFEDAAKIAQAKFDEWLEKQPVITLQHAGRYYGWAKGIDATHQGRIVDLKPIKNVQ